MIDDKSSKNIIGVIPAAGTAQRLQPMPWSKELMPIGIGLGKSIMGMKFDVVIGHLIECMQIADAEKAFVVIRKGKWDIPAFLGNGSSHGLPLAYVVTEILDGVPFSVDQTYSFVSAKHVLFGFPDILFKPKTALRQLLQRREITKADIVLGLFPTRNHAAMDMVEITSKGRVVAVQVKPKRTRLKWTWILAVWGRNFRNYLHDTISKFANEPAKRIKGAEIHMGHVLQSAIRADIYVDTVSFPSGRCVDIGTPERLCAYLLDRIEWSK